MRGRIPRRARGFHLTLGVVEHEAGVRGKILGRGRRDGHGDGILVTGHVDGGGSNNCLLRGYRLYGIAMWKIIAIVIVVVVVVVVG